MFYVYVLKSEKDGRLYISQTSNLKKRLKEHNSGQNKSTKDRYPLKLVYCEVYLSSKDATIGETRLKKFKNSYTELKKRIKYSIDDRA